MTAAMIGAGGSGLQLFGVSAFGQKMGLRITEGLGLVVVT